MPTKKELEEKLKAIEEKQKEISKYKNQYIRENYKRVSCNIKPDIYNRIIDKYGNISINGYINNLIKKDLGIEQE